MTKDALWAPAELCGHLHKFGPRNCTWRRRFFALKGGNLFYFRSAGARRPLGVIPLEGALVAAEQLEVPVGPLVRSGPRVLHTIQVALAPDTAARHPHRAYLLAAPTPELQELWISALVEASLPRDLLLAAAQQAVDAIALQQQHVSKSIPTPTGENPPAERRSALSEPPPAGGAPQNAATWQEWQQRLRQSQVVARPSVVQQLVPRASQPAAALAASSGQLQRLSQAGLEAAAVEIGEQPSAIGAVGTAVGTQLRAPRPNNNGQEISGSHVRLQQLKQLAASPRRRRWSFCWGLCQLSDEEAPSTVGDGGDSDGTGSHMSHGGGEGSGAASVSTRISQTTQQWAAHSMSVAQTAKLRQSMMQRASAANTSAAGAAEQASPGVNGGYEAGVTESAHVDALNLRPALPSAANLVAHGSLGSEERWQGLAGRNSLVVASLSGSGGGLAPRPSTSPDQPTRAQRGSVSDGGIIPPVRRSSRRPVSTVLAERGNAAGLRDAARGDGADAARALRPSAASRPSQVLHHLHRGHAAEPALRRSTHRSSSGGAGATAATAGGADDTLSLITTFDDDIDSNAAAGWRVAPGRYTRGNSGWLDFAAPQGRRGSGDTQSASSGFLSDFGSKEGAPVGWGTTRKGDEGSRPPEGSTGGDTSGMGTWGARASGGGSGGGGAGWGPKASLPVQRHHRHRDLDNAGHRLDAFDAAALRQQLQVQQQQLDALTNLVVLQQQQQQQQQQAAQHPIGDPAVVYSHSLTPASGPPPQPESALPARSVPVRASAMVGRVAGVQSMVRTLQGTARRSAGHNRAGETAADDIPSPPSAVPLHSTRVSSGGAAGGSGAVPFDAVAAPSDALAEYDAVSRDLRTQFLQRLSAQQLASRLSATDDAGADKVTTEAADHMIPPLGADGDSGPEDWPYQAGEQEEHISSGDGGGASSGSNGGSSSFTLGNGVLGAEKEAPIESIMTAVDQLRGSVAHLQHQLAVPHSVAEGDSLPNAARHSRAVISAPASAQKPPPVAPPPPPVFHPAPMPRQARSSMQAAASASRVSRVAAAVSAVPDSTRARLLQEVVAGAEGGVKLRHVARPSQVARAAAAR